MKQMIKGGRSLLMIVAMVLCSCRSPGGLCLAALSVVFPDDPGNFKGMWWGQYLGALKDMKFVNADRTNAGEFYYIKRDDLLTG